MNPSKIVDDEVERAPGDDRTAQMHPESATVVVRKLLQSPRPVTGTDRALRQPRVDDQGAVVRIIDADRRTVECVDSSGRTLWLGDLHVMSSPRRSSTGPFSLQRSAPAPIAQRETVLAVCTWSQPTAIRTRQLQTAASSPCGIPTDRPASPRSRAAGSHRVASVAVAPAGQRRYVSPMQKCVVGGRHRVVSRVERTPRRSEPR